MKKLLILLIIAGTVFSVANAGDCWRDPLVKISILPNDIDVEDFLPKLSKDISDASGVPESGITVIWNEIPAKRMITGGKLGIKNENEEHPVVVELNLAGFFTQEEIEETMEGIAESFEEHTNVDSKQVFIITTLQESGKVYVFDETMKWEDGENPFAD